ncbi:MAG TPA: PQQ-dependent sugar dehydrogenase [Longimicrobiaceae bacterium]|jgi:glucose/arabinose dehydrogenase|nr:PQQ-dependent sugar dehydrogenase [Longimicrobiaceae bacterium]
MHRASAVLAAAVSLAACSGGDGAGQGPPATTGLRLVGVASGLESPLYLTAPAGDARLFVVEQPGRIRIVENGALLPTPFLDITDRVSSGGERGLLSVAFHPRYASNGLLYVDYTDRNGDTRVERYHVSADRNRADPASAQLVLAVAQPFANHNGGLVAFGPDGMLYVGMGDGGSGGDPQRNGQNPAALLGKLLRLDVDAAQPYAIPTGNPFAGQPGRRGEIWATGMRNPWRFSWDRSTGLLYVADVGQNAWEEVDVVPAAAAGLNYGWNTMEATHCFQPSSGCSTAGLTLPVLEYGHADGCSVTGGYVYRGAAMPSLRGTYFYADYCGGWVRSFRFTAGAVTEGRTWELGQPGSILSFGEDAAGELYVLSAQGKVFRLAPA